MNFQYRKEDLRGRGSAALLARLCKFHGPEKRRKPRKGGKLMIPVCQDIRIRAVIRETCAKHGVEIRNFFSRSRVKARVNARREAAYRLRTEFNLSYPRIASEFGGMDHSTIIHAVRRYRLGVRG